MRRVLLTGATGFVGQAIAEKLVADGFEVYGTGNRRSGETPLILSDDKKIKKIFRLDISDANAVNQLKALEFVPVIVHCAGLAHQFGKIEKKKFWQINVVGTKNVLDLAEELRAEHFVLISSVSVYGSGQTNRKGVLKDEESACCPRGFYAESKLASERAAAEFCRRKNIKLTVLRLATVIGKNDPGNFRRLIETIARRRFIWIGNGENYKSLIEREDVARVCAAVIESRDAAAEIYNVSAEPLQMAEIVKIIETELGVETPAIRIPARIFSFFGKLNERTLRVKKIAELIETVDRWLADDAYANDKLKKNLNFECRYNAREAVARETKWLKEINRKRAAEDSSEQ